MLYLRTGLPGASKTLNSIKEIVEDVELRGRPRYYYNVKLFFLDYYVCDSFQGYFYGHYLPSLDAKTEKKVRKIILKVHRDDELVSDEHFPHLRGSFEAWRLNGGPLDLFLHWALKLYPKKVKQPLTDYLDLVDTPSWDDIQQFNLHFDKFIDPTGWYKLPKGSVILIDECQKAFPPRPVGSKVPIHVSEFETHRHGGYDVHLITQDAKLLDSHVRRLAGRHIHYHNPLASKKVSRLQADKVFDPSDYFQKKNTISSLITRDEKYYGVYWSADLHTHKIVIPKKLVTLVIVALAVPVGVIYWFSYRFDTSHLDNNLSSVERVVSESSSLSPLSHPVSRPVPRVIPAHAFDLYEHPLTGYCDKISFAGKEFIRSKGRSEQKFYLQCEIFSADKKSDDEFSVVADAFLLDSNYLNRLGYFIRFERGLMTLAYGDLTFVFHDMG